MEQDQGPTARKTCFARIVALIVGITVQVSHELEFAIDLSRKGLSHIPRDLPSTTEVLDVSQNHIAQLQTPDFAYLLRLKVLRLSHNRIQRLDFRVFKSNHNLEYLDLSHNQLRSISCHPVSSLTHLDLSFNHFLTLPICMEFGNSTQLKFLGLSAAKFQELDLLPIAHLHLRDLLLDFGGYQAKEFETESLQIPSTKTLQIVFPPNRLFSVRANISVNTLGSFQLTNIKLNNEKCHLFMTFLSALTKGPTLVNCTLHHVETTWKCLVRVFQFLWPKPVEYLSIYNLTITESIDEEDFTYSPTALKALKIEHVTSPVFLFTQTALYSVFAEMNIRMLTISDTRFVHMLCPQNPSTFTFLNFSQNVLTDSVFQNCSTLTRLETLILQKNGLQNLMKVSLMTRDMLSLETLDLSWNSLDCPKSKGMCIWAENISVLNLSSNVLTESVFRCLPPRVKILDLHGNKIKSIPKQMMELEALRELNVAFNSLADLPGCQAFSSLSVLVVDHNSVSHPSADFFHTCQKISSLAAGSNPFQCTCELRAFVRNISRVASAVLQGWPDSYKCDYPESYRDTLLRDFHVSPVSCNTVLLTVTIGAAVLLLAATLTFLCVHFDLLWYLRMLYQWTETRRRARNVPLEERQRHLQFHAFVSYSGHDSDWVRNELLPNLEKENIRICLHERNFVPGKSIVENIINFIEKSYKSIFVLSPHFVQSEWCHYELYFAHHNLFHEGSDNLILILLEPIPQNSIPGKYHKLRALMAQRTYLEWPLEKSKRGLFWANIIAAFNMKLALIPENNAEG